MFCNHVNKSFKQIFLIYIIQSKYYFDNNVITLSGSVSMRRGYFCSHNGSHNNIQFVMLRKCYFMSGIIVKYNEYNINYTPQLFHKIAFGTHSNSSVVKLFRLYPSMDENVFLSGFHGEEFQDKPGNLISNIDIKALDKQHNPVWASSCS